MAQYLAARSSAGKSTLTSSRRRANVCHVETMSTVFASTMSARCISARGRVCARRDCARTANFVGRGIVAGIEREPQPTTYEGKAPDA